MDREKQDGLYVRVGRDGTIVSRPSSVRLETAREAFERARRFGQFTRQLSEDSTYVSYDYDRIRQLLNALFATLETGPEKTKRSAS